MVFTLTLRMLKNREEAEEIAQDVFIKVYRSLHKFKGESKLSTWIYKVTYYACLDQLKKTKKYEREVAINEFNANQLEIIDNALGHLIAEERRQLVKRCIDRLSSENAYLITLFYFEELSLDEIAEVIGAKANAVKVKLFRARQKLAEIIKELMSPEELMNYGTQG